MENKAERYQKAVNIMDVLEQSPFAKIMKKGAIVRQGILFRQTELIKLIQEDFPKIIKLDIVINPELSKITP